MTSAEDQFLMGGGGAPSAFTKDTPINVEIGGRILDRKLAQQTDIKGVPLWWDDAQTRPREQLVVTVQTTLRDNADDDGRRRFFVKGDLQYTVRDAVQAVGAPGIQIGGELYVARTGKDTPKERGLDGAWLHRARYIPATDTFLGANGAGQAAASAQNGGTQNGAPGATQSVPTPSMTPGAGYVTPPAPTATQPPATTTAQPPAATPEMLSEAELLALNPDQRASVVGMIAAGQITAATARIVYAAQLQGVA